MKLTGEQRIAASREQVWRALNDPDVLRQCIPGCQSLEKESDERMTAIVEIKIGPIGARLKGAVTLSDLDPPKSYTITGEGQGGTVGFAKGGAKVSLEEVEGGTLLSYEVDAQVGGRLAQLGGRIIDATAKQLSGKFFQKFGQIVEAPAPAEAAADAAAQATSAPGAVRHHAPAPQAATGGRFPSFTWILALAVAALVGFLIGRGQADAAGSDWMGLAIGLLVIIIAAAGFEFGRRAAAPVIMVDPALLARAIADGRP